jgi:RES domain-containing protein
MLSGDALDQAIRELLTRPLRGTWLRAMRLKYASDPLGRRRPIVAGRFNLAGGARVLYLGDSHVTCLHEVQAFGIPFNAVAVVPVTVSLQAVLDLADPAIVDRLHTTRDELALNFRLRPQPTASQHLGDRCVMSGVVDGILYPSLAVSGGASLAVLEASLRRGASSLVVDDPSSGLHDELP